VKRWMFALTVLLLLLLAPRVNAATGDYILHPSDELTINVFGCPELSFPAPGNPDSITIRSDGKISFPLVGEVKAEGLTTQDLAELLDKSLKKYYVNPVVTVNVLHFSTQRVYVFGEVNAPGLYELDKSRNLLDAIGAAKGWTKEAAKTKVFVIRKNQTDHPIRVNLLDLLNKGNLSENLCLQEGDIIYLTENHRIDVTKDILPWTQVYYNLETTNVFGGSQ